MKFQLQQLSPELAAGVFVGESVGFTMGESVGDPVGLFVGDAAGSKVGAAVGASVGLFVGELVGGEGLLPIGVPSMPVHTHDIDSQALI